MIDLWLFPAGGNAREAVGIVDAINQRSPTIRVLGFLDDDPRLHGTTLGGHRVVGGRDVMQQRSEAKVLAVPGSPSSFRERLELIRDLRLPSNRWATLVHPSVQLGRGVQIGPNVLLMAGVVATADVTIRSHCVILPNTVLSHDVSVGEGSMIGSNVSVSGGVRIEDECYVGSGARIIQDVRIARHTLIGLGSVILRDTREGTTVVGNPGRVLEQ